MVITADCSVLMTANAGEAAFESQVFVNPEGSISVFKFHKGDLSKAPTTHTVTFETIGGDKDDARAPLALELHKAGVNWQMGPHTPIPSGKESSYPMSMRSLTRNLQPKHMTLSADETMLYVSMQLNNAVATIDTRDMTLISIKPLGTKYWSQPIDTSDRDGVLNAESGVKGAAIKMMDTYGEMQGLYMPDSIASFAVGSTDYIVSANEGDHVSYTQGNNAHTFECKMTGAQMADKLDASIDTKPLRAMLTDESQLARLGFDCACGLDPASDTASKYTKLCTMGTRSWSIWRASDMRRVFDSGSMVEELHIKFAPEIFNANGATPGKKQTDSMDSRSIHKGPEVEAVTVGTYMGRTLAFVACERTSTLMIYDVSSPANPVFQSMHKMESSSAMPATLQNGDVRPFAADVGIIDPETLHWDAETSQLFVAGAVSGTVAVYKVSAAVDGIIEAVWASETMDMVTDQSGASALTTTSSMVLLATCAMGMLFAI